MGLLKTNKSFTIVCLILLSTTVMAQSEQDAIEYRRSSLYQLMIGHMKQEFASEIKQTFLHLSMPEQYNDHNLSVRVIETVRKVDDVKKNRENDSITAFLEKNHIASRLVARWFNRDMENGVCDMSLIKERGLYNANEFDRQMAMQSVRGMSLLEDAGEDLINNTFVVVNDIQYIDKNKTARIAGAVTYALAATASVAMRNDSFKNMGESIVNMTNEIDGFRVKINSFLYRLVWNDTIANNFYTNHYTSTPDETKARAFEDARENYRLEYVGKVESSGGTTSFYGIAKERRDLMLLKALQRAIDENIADLQQNFEVFRVKTPLVSTDPLTAYIGLKEGMTDKSRYEVLEVVQKENGKISYKRVGVIAPEVGKIWDNRCMADLEKAENSDLNCTTFKVISGKNFCSGMLIREISSN